jgi:formylmethanofuran dehydrogenase subunit E
VNISDLPAPQLFVDLAARHGHFCPMSTLGLRMGWAARLRLTGDLLIATYFAPTCARDGIRLALNCETLQFEEQGRHLLCFCDNDSQWEIELLPQSLELAALYRSLTSDAERDCLLEQLRSADESSLMKIVQSGGSL